MKKSILLIVLLMLIPLGTTCAQDNVYGDYFMAVSQKLISLDLEGANLVDVLKMLSQQTGLNFIATEAVRERKLTLYLENTPLKEAMDIIFKANNLTYDYYPDANMFVVKEMGRPTVELRTKVYRLKYARLRSSAMQDEIEQKITASTAQTQGQVIGGTQSGGSGGGGGSSGGASSSEKDKEANIKEIVKKILTEFGKINEDPLTGSLIVTDVPSQFATIDEVIYSLDIPVPKVMVEVEMLDVSKTLADKIGVSYGENGFNAAFTPGSMITPFPFPGRMLKTMFPGGTTTAANSRVASFGTLSLADMTVTLQLLSTDTTTKFLARPKIMTISDQTAEVNLTTDEAIGVTTEESETGTTQRVERTETGTKLRVTPHVNPVTKEITLFVEVFNRQATDTTIRLSGMSAGFLKNPEERGTRAVSRLRNGETLLIGGLIQNTDTTTVTKIPFLGDIPIIGNAFRHKTKDDEKRELLVFLTPRVIDDTPVLARREGFDAHREQDSFQRESMRMAMDRYSRE